MLRRVAMVGRLPRGGERQRAHETQVALLFVSDLEVRGERQRRLKLVVADCARVHLLVQVGGGVR